jgi:hypothetical protein
MVAGTRNSMRVSSPKPTEAAPECACGLATQARAGIGEHIPLVSAILIALLPKCPLCLAAWLGIIGSASVSSWLNRVWGVPLTAGFLSIAIGTLALRAWRQRDSRPFWLGLLGAAAVLYGKCIVTVPLLLLAGLGLLIGATFWNRAESGKNPDREICTVFSGSGSDNPGGDRIIRARTISPNTCRISCNPSPDKIFEHRAQ